MTEDGSGQLRDEEGAVPWWRDTVPGGWSQGEGAARAGVAAQWVDEKGHTYGVATFVSHLCIPALPVLAAGSHLNFNLSPLASQQDNPLPRLQSHLPPSPPPPPFTACGCFPAAPCRAGTALASRKDLAGREKASTAALFGDFTSISISLINHAPRGNPGPDPTGTAK